MPHMIALMKRAGIELDGYESESTSTTDFVEDYSKVDDHSAAVVNTIKL